MGSGPEVHGEASWGEDKKIKSETGKALQAQRLTALIRV